VWSYTSTPQNVFILWYLVKQREFTFTEDSVNEQSSYSSSVTGIAQKEPFPRQVIISKQCGFSWYMPKAFRKPPEHQEDSLVVIKRGTLNRVTE